MQTPLAASLRWVLALMTRNALAPAPKDILLRGRKLLTSSNATSVPQT